MKTIYGVEVMIKSTKISINGEEHNLPLTWADGMLGVMPIFKTREQAKTIANKFSSECNVLELEVEDN